MNNSAQDRLTIHTILAAELSSLLAFVTIFYCAGVAGTITYAASLEPNSVESTMITRPIPRVLAAYTQKLWSLDGSTGIPLSSVNKKSQTRSVGLWLKTNSSGTLLGSQNGAGLDIASPEQNGVLMLHDDTFGAKSFTGTHSITDDNWHYITVAKQPGVWLVFVDGVLDIRLQTDPLSNAFFSVVGENGFGSRYLLGSIKGLRSFPYAIGAPELAGVQDIIE